MFGYISLNKGELKLKDYEKYQAFYCGLCKSLAVDYGRAAQMTLTFDMTFLTVLLTSLYELPVSETFEHCLLHPTKRHKKLRSEASHYAASMNVLLAYHNLMDDWFDDHEILKLSLAKALQKPYKEAEYAYPVQAKAVRTYIHNLHRCEKRKIADLDCASGYTGRLLAEIFAWRKDEWTVHLKRMGFYMGKYIYLMDAFEDRKKDKETGQYNPWLLQPKENQTEAYCHHVMQMMMADCAREFEYLPIIENTDILRNIIYSGVWYQYARITAEKEQEKKILC